MISVYVRSIDGINDVEEFSSKEEAFEYIYRYLGDSFEIGSSYAVNFFGDVTVSVDGWTLREYADMARDRKIKNYG